MPLRMKKKLGMKNSKLSSTKSPIAKGSDPWERLEVGEQMEFATLDEKELGMKKMK